MNLRARFGPAVRPLEALAARIVASALIKLSEAPRIRGARQEAPPSRQSRKPAVRSNREAS